jgi:hypothetical protein
MQCIILVEGAATPPPTCMNRFSLDFDVTVFFLTSGLEGGRGIAQANTNIKPSGWLLQRLCDLEYEGSAQLQKP